ALIGLDIGGVVMALHLEDRRQLPALGPVADIDHAGILARPADHPRGLGRQLLQMQAAGFIGAMLRPHDGKDAEFDQIRLSAQRLQDALIFLGAEAVRLDDRGSDFGHAGALSSASRDALVTALSEAGPGARLTRCPMPANASPMEEQGHDIAGMSFEQALRALEDVVRKLESGEVALDES